MSLSKKISIVVRCSLPLAGFVLANCTVTTTARPAQGTLTVQPPAANVSVQTQPAVVQTQPVYAQPQPQPVYAQPQPVYTGQPVVAPVYQAPPSVVGGGWVTTGYAENDYVSYHMSLRARQFAAGYVPITQLYRSQMGQGQRQYVTVTASPGRCYRIIGVGGVGVRDLDLRLRDMSGNVIDQDVATDNFPVIGLQHQLCPTTPGAYRLEVLMYAGAGEFGVQVYGN